MARNNRAILLIAFCVTISICSANGEEFYDSDKFVSSLISHLNKLPGQSYTYKDGKLISAQEKSPFTYKIEAKLEALCNNPEKCLVISIECNGYVEMDSQTGEIYITDDNLNCLNDELKSETAESTTEAQVIKLEIEPTMNVKENIVNIPKLHQISENIPADEDVIISGSIRAIEGFSLSKPDLIPERSLPVETSEHPISSSIKSQQIDENISLEGIENQMNNHQYILEDLQRVMPLDIDKIDDSNENIQPEMQYKDQELKLSSDEEDLHSVQLTHEVQPVGKATSGEQFVAVRRVSGDICSDCASDVDVNATGVDKLVALALQHLDRHDNLHKHEINTVIRVQRQVQIVNGVRYILLIDVNFLSIPDKNKISIETKRCKISFLEKPWLRLNDGSKFRAVVSNNCTEQYLFGDSGEIVSNIADSPKTGYKKDIFNELDANYPDSPPLGDQAQVPVTFDTKVPNYDSVANSGKADDIMKMVHNKDLQSAKPSEEIPIDPDRFEDLVSQIIPTNSENTHVHSHIEVPELHSNHDAAHENKKKWMVLYDIPEYNKRDGGMFKPIQYDSPHEEPTTVLSDEKKEALEDFMKLLGGFDNFNSPNSVKDPTPHELPKPDIIFNVETDSGKTTSDCPIEKTLIELPVSQVSEDDRVIRVDFIGDSSSSLEDDTVVSYISRKRRSVFDKSTDSKEFLMSLANLATDTLDDYDDDDEKRIVLEILTVEHADLKDGVVYTMDLNVGYSNCSEKKGISTPCSSTPHFYQVKHCTVKIYAPAVGQPKVMYCQCKQDTTFTSRRKRQLIGGAAAVSTTDKNVVDLTHETLQRLEAQSFLTNRRKVVNIKSATRQLVKGLIYRIKFETGYTDCPKSDQSKALEDCGLVEGLNEECEAEIYYIPWEKNTEKSIKTSCNKISLKRRKRDLASLRDSVEALPKLLSEALVKVEESFPHANKQKVNEVLYFGRPHSSNVLHRIKFTVGITNCSIGDLKNDICVVGDRFGPNKNCTAELTKQNSLELTSLLKVDCEVNEADNIDPVKFMKARRQFVSYIFKYNRPYMNNDTELNARFRIFRKNLNIIKDLNFHEQGTASYGVTQFFDLTPEEFRVKYTGLNTNLKNLNNIPFPLAEIPQLQDIPISYDWRDQNAVTPVKDQGQCGSCWAFSVTGNIEGQWKIKKGDLLSLSEQELVDCDKLDEGCNGGLPDNAYRAIEQLGGLELENDYPYDAKDETCHFNKSISRVQISGAVNISSNEDDMQKWLLQNGPISIGINANAMQFYMGGVSHPWKLLCNPTNLDHGVLIVGYGIHNYPLFHQKLPYWTIKNSWGDNWGEQGYYRVYRGDGTCGVNQMASSAVVS